MPSLMNDIKYYQTMGASLKKPSFAKLVSALGAKQGHSCPYYHKGNDHI